MNKESIVEHNEMIFEELNLDCLLNEYRERERDMGKGELFVKLLSYMLWLTHKGERHFSFEWIIENIGKPDWQFKDEHDDFEIWYSFNKQQYNGLIKGKKNRMNHFSTCLDIRQTVDKRKGDDDAWPGTV